MCFSCYLRPLPVGGMQTHGIVCTVLYSSWRGRGTCPPCSERRSFAFLTVGRMTDMSIGNSIGMVMACYVSR
jgi:hypothetical protein